MNTGIEITFDQDGVTDAASHVTIEPKTAGRFEQHGRVLAFVPDALKPGTIYTVTVGRGITAGPGGKPMADDFRFQFETDKAGAAAGTPPFDFADILFESGTTSRPIISMWAETDEDTAPPKSAQARHLSPGDPRRGRSAPTGSSGRTRRGRDGPTSISWTRAR